MKLRFATLGLFLFFAAGCAEMASAVPDLSSWKLFGAEDTEKNKEEKERPQEEEDTYSAVLSVNPYLWQAALDELSFMPLASADSKGGVIVTDWKSMPGVSDEQFKITIAIYTRDLRADSLKAEVFERENINGQWADKKTDPRLSDELEKAILYRARDLFRRDIMTR